MAQSDISIHNAEVSGILDRRPCPKKKAYLSSDHRPRGRTTGEIHNSPPSPVTTRTRHQVNNMRHGGSGDTVSRSRWEIISGERTSARCRTSSAHQRPAPAISDVLGKQAPAPSSSFMWSMDGGCMYVINADGRHYCSKFFMQT